MRARFGRSGPAGRRLPAALASLGRRGAPTTGGRWLWREQGAISRANLLPAAGALWSTYRGHGRQSP